MDSPVLSMLEKYNCQTKEQYQSALKEIVQEISLLGLWRSKFFEHATFYGGSALRILYGLNRFSEDLDFSLMDKQTDLNLNGYFNAIEEELTAFGFNFTIERKIKSQRGQIESAFIKGGTILHFIKAGVPPSLTEQTQGNELIKIKLEIDIDPPLRFETEMKNLFEPIPFQVRSMTKENLFAGKIHAVLTRKWKVRVKGRDFYDLLWYIGQKTPCNLAHLEARLIQSGDWNANQKLDKKILRTLLVQKIENTNFNRAREDVTPFLKIRDLPSLELWSSEYFKDVIQEIKTVSTT